MARIITDAEFERIQHLQKKFYGDVDAYKETLEDGDSFMHDFESIMEILETDHHPMPDDGGLTGILQTVFLCEKPFLVEPKIIGRFHGDNNDPAYEYFTEAGAKAYENLITLIHRLQLIGVISDSDEEHIVENLDEIVTRGY